MSDAIITSISTSLIAEEADVETETQAVPKTKSTHQQNLGDTKDIEEPKSTLQQNLDDIEQSPSLKRRRTLIYLICALMYFMAVLFRLSVASVKDLLSERLDVPQSQLATFSSIYFWTYSLAQPIGGTLADVMEPAWILTASGVISAIGMFVMCSPNYSVALVGRAITGLGQAPIYMPAATLLSAWYPADRFALLCAFLIFVGGIATVVAQYPLRALTQAVGVAYTMMGCAAVSLLLAVLALTVIRADPTITGKMPPLMRAGTSGAKSTVAKMWRNTRSVLGTGHFYLISFHGMFNSGGYFTVTGLWVTDFLAAYAGIDTDASSQLAMMLGVLYAIGNPFWAWMSDTLSTRKKCLVGCTVVVVVIEICFTVLDNWSSLSVTLALCLYTFTSDAPATIAYTSVKEYFPSTITGCAMSWFNLVLYVGAAIIQQVTRSTVKPCEGGEYCDDSFSLGLWGLLAAGEITALVLIMFWPETFGGRQTELEKHMAVEVVDELSVPIDPEPSKTPLQTIDHPQCVSDEL